MKDRKAPMAANEMALHDRRRSAGDLCVEGGYRQCGGEGGIRTHGTLAGTTVFETAPIDHSGTSPQRSKQEAVEPLASR